MALVTAGVCYISPMMQLALPEQRAATLPLSSCPSCSASLPVLPYSSEAEPVSFLLPSSPSAPPTPPPSIASNTVAMQEAARNAAAASGGKGLLGKTIKTGRRVHRRRPLHRSTCSPSRQDAVRLMYGLPKDPSAMTDAEILAALEQRYPDCDSSGVEFPDLRTGFLRGGPRSEAASSFGAH